MKRLLACGLAALFAGHAVAQYTVDPVGFLVDSTGRRVGFKKADGGEVFFATLGPSLDTFIKPDGTTLAAGTGDVTLGGIQTLTNKTLTSPTINSPTIATPTITGGAAFANAGTGAFNATLTHNGTMTAGRTLTLNLNDAARTVSLTGNLTLAGSLTTAGAFGTTLTATGTTSVTLPTSGTLATTTQALSETICVAASDETTALTTGTGKVTFRMPFAMTLTSVRTSINTAQASGSILTVDVNEGGTTVLSTKSSIDNNEKTSTTAATASVVSDTSLADDAEITVDIDAVDGSTAAKGLKVCLIGSR
jgi:hypothetical protein